MPLSIFSADTEFFNEQDARLTAAFGVQAKCQPARLATLPARPKREGLTKGVTDSGNTLFLHKFYYGKIYEIVVVLGHCC